MKKTIGLISFFWVACSCANYGVSSGIGTLGLGFNGLMYLNDNLCLDVGINRYNYKFDAKTWYETKLTPEFHLDSYHALLYYRIPFLDMKICSGLFYNNSNVDISILPAGIGSYVVGQERFNVAAVGAISGNISFRKIAPYIGVGWGYENYSGFGIATDIGVVLQGNAKLTLNTSGSLTNPLSQQLEVARQNLENDVNSHWFVTAWPVLSIKVYYNF